MSAWMIAAVVITAVCLDKRWQEPTRWHPLVGFGRYAQDLEQRFFVEPCNQATGVWVWCVAVLPWVGLAYLVQTWLSFWLLQSLVSALVLYWAIGWQSLIAHAQAVQKRLADGDLFSARKAVALLVSRDTDTLDANGMAKAATESVLENGADAIFAPIFWFAIAGLPGVVLYRLANTLDAMWGYRNRRYRYVGWFSARMDDVLNYIPARLTALSYALVGNMPQAFHSWYAQARHCKSPNAGAVMASGAGAIYTTLGGGSAYNGVFEPSPVLGPEMSNRSYADHSSIGRACGLINRTLGLWLLVLLLLCWA